jgi:sRNA-binding regulator protein Hfq
MARKGEIGNGYRTVLRARTEATLLYMHALSTAALHDNVLYTEFECNI